MSRVRILGAGVSGLCCAINLAKEGFEVEVIDKAAECGSRFNGDFQGFENSSKKSDVLDDLKSMNIKTNFFYHTLDKFSFYDYKFLEKRFDSDNPAFYLVKRGSMDDCLDIGLKKQALDLGVQISFNKHAPLDDIDVVATGPSKVDALAFGITFDTKSPDFGGGIFSNYVAPGGYAYLLISEGIGTIATVVFRDYDNSKIYLKRSIDSWKKIVDVDIGNPVEFAGFGNFTTRRPYELEGRIFVGEAAGLQDYLLGFGIRFAVDSGYLGAKSLIEGVSYSQLIYDNMADRLDTSIVNRFLFNQFGDRGYQHFIKSLDSNNPVNSLYRAYNMGYKRRLIKPFVKKV